METTGNEGAESSSNGIRGSFVEQTTYPSAIFVYSGFRAGSTWFWSKLREFDALRCYYEPFNEQLALLTQDNIDEASSTAWRSHHPASAPYMREYASLLSDKPGVQGFPAGDPLTVRYVDQAGVNGPLDEDLGRYIETLIDAAHEQGRIPVLACTRLLGRPPGIRQAFQGVHILLVRNLFQQWNSYAGQARFENFYFLSTLYDSLALAERDEFIHYLKGLLWDKSFENLAQWIEPDNFDRVFCYFVGFHLYFLLHASRNVDLIIDINTLAKKGSSAIAAVEATLFERIGIRLNLGDARENVDYPLYPIADPQHCAAMIREITDHLRSQYATSQEEQSFIDGLVTDLWAEQERYQTCIRGAEEFIQRLEKQLKQAEDRLQSAARSDSQREIDMSSMDQRLQDALTRSTESEDRLAEALMQFIGLESQLRRTEEEKDTLVGDLTTKQQELHQCRADIAAALGRIDELTLANTGLLQLLNAGAEREAILKRQFAQATALAHHLEDQHRDISVQLSEMRDKRDFEIRQRRRLLKILHAQRQDQRGRRVIAWLVDILTKQRAAWLVLPESQRRKRLIHLLEQGEISSPTLVDPLVDAILQAVKSGRFG